MIRFLCSLLLCLPVSGLLAAAPKVLHLAMTSAESGFDPVMTSDLNTAAIEAQLFESLLTYDYLARPVTLRPQLTERMPEVSDQGRVWRFALKKGVLFAPDPVFKGVPRELTCRDVTYTVMRFLDPKNRSPYRFLFAGKIQGLDQRGEQAARTGRFDYDSPVEGLRCIDSHTLEVHLRSPDYNFGHALAQPMTGIVAREVIEAYAPDTVSHPVGTGPYRLTHWTRAARMVLEKNPNYRHTVWDFQPGSDPEDQRVVAQMRGKTIPQIDRIELDVIEEPQSVWLSFGRGELDIIGVPAQFAPLALTGSRLKPEWVARGVRLDRIPDPSIGYYFINQQDPVLGGQTRERIGLRRALFMAQNDDEMIRVIAKGQAFRNPYPIPPGVAGADPHYRSLLDYNPAAANRLLDELGYQRGADGYRRQPDGAALVVHSTTGLSSQDRELDEVMKKSLDRIGIHLAVDKLKFPDIIRNERQCRIQMRLSGWIADYPDGDNFMQLWYGPHTHENNASCFQDPTWDRLYERTLTLPDSPERNRIYHQLARLLELDGVTKVSTTHIRNTLSQPWVLGYKAHPILPSIWSYLDVAPSRSNAP